MTEITTNQEGGRDAATILNLALGGEWSTKVRKGLATYALTSTAVAVGRRWVRSARSHMTYTVAVNGNDSIYADLHRWLLELLPEPRRKALTAQTERRDAIQSSDDGAPRDAMLGFFYDGTRQQTVRIGDHRITVAVVKPEVSLTDFLRDDYEPRRLPTSHERIIFTAYSRSGRDAVMELLARITHDHYAAIDQPDLHMADRWGNGFDRRRDLPRRPLNTVVLAPGQKEQLIDDLSTFLRQENDYARLGIPWHRGYLLHGPPGTGKTSLAKALAGHFGLDVYYIPLSDQKGDANLLGLLGRVRPRSMLLLEDIDILHASTTRDEEQGRLSQSGLLNALDGVATPHGLIKVLTTNNLEALDPAVLRPGRVDVHMKIGNLTDSQLHGLFDMFYGDSGHELPSLQGARISPAEAIEVFKRNIGDPALASRELEMWMSSTGAAR